MEMRYEAVVAGGGPAGCAAALALVRGGRRVLLLDDSAAGDFKMGEALPPAGRPLLRDLGVLERFLEGGHLACFGNLSAWGGPALRETDFIFDRNGHGWHLDRARFDAGLRAAARDAGAHVREGVRVTSAERGGARWSVSFDGVSADRAPTGREIGRRESDERRSADGGPAERGSDDGDQGEHDRDGRDFVECDWVIDATGRRSTIARKAGTERVHADALVAFHARFRTANGGDRDSRTMIESVPGGWWYTALVPGTTRVVAFLTDADLADRATLLSADGFAARLEETVHVGGVLRAHGYAIDGRPRGADAGSARLDRFSGDGWLAAGDAAVSFDPLSSQGMLTALYTGLRAGQALAAHLAGDGVALDAYVARLEEVHRAYTANRMEYYALEPRWRHAPFWARRVGSRAGG